MERDPAPKEFLHNQIKGYLEKGYVRQLRSDEILPKNKIWLIPIFSVYNKNKRKSRLVWDAAAKVGDTALNTFLLKGREFTFREKRVAIRGDIRNVSPNLYNGRRPLSIVISLA